VTMLPMLISAKNCKWSTSMDFSYNVTDKDTQYKLLVRSFREPDVYLSTYFKIEKRVQTKLVDMFILSLDEAEFFVKFIRSPSETVCIHKGNPRNLHLSLKHVEGKDLIQFLFMYPRSSSIKYVERQIATQFGKTFDSVIPTIKQC